MEIESGWGFIATLALFAFVMVVVGLTCQWLWNVLMPEIFGLKQITFWQALGLMVLSSCFLYRGGGGKSAS